MSWLYLPEQGGGCSPHSTYSDGKPSATSRTETTQCWCSRQGSGMGCSTMRQSGVTLELSTGDRGVEWWIALLLASRASPGPQEEKGKGNTTPATSGLTRFALLERSGQAGFSWKTLQDCFKFPTNGNALLTSSKSAETWPSWGTWDAGAAYRQRPLDTTTNGNGCGLLPTPVTRDGASFYVTTYQTALRIMRKTGSSSRQLHWMQYGVISHGLKKGWANPRFSELMMDWPIGWTDLQPLGRGRFQEWLQQHGDY